jgi:hypothetical protein
MVSNLVSEMEGRTQKNVVFWDVLPGALIRTEVKEEYSGSIIRVTRIGELRRT